MCHWFIAKKAMDYSTNGSQLSDWARDHFPFNEQIKADVAQRARNSAIVSF